ncbi:MAG: aminopeptidase [Bdellovibrionales bacterium]
MKIFFLLTALMTLTSCHLNYLVKSGYHQAKILSRQIPLEEARKLPHLNEEQRRKLDLASEVMQFIVRDLKLQTFNNYSTYSQLDGPYVTYAVSAAEAYRLQPYLWHFPIVGDVPYKGFFEEQDAKVESDMLSTQGYDTYVRGVSAYSTLGWFKDPLLSSMLRYEDSDLVNTLIHETIHANLYIKSSADFNERLATFLGNLGTELFYAQKLGTKNSIMAAIQQVDNKLFSDFITKELEDLKQWYVSSTPTAALKEARLKEIQTRFTKNIRPRLKTRAYEGFEKEPLNNAKLLAYSTYMADLSEFQKVYDKMGKDFGKFFEFCKSLASSGNPEEDLKR